MLSPPPSSACCCLLTHPASSRTGKEGEKLTYFRDVQKQGSPEFSVSWRTFFISHLLCGKYSWNLNSHDLTSVYEIGSITLTIQMKNLRFHLNLKGGERGGSRRFNFVSMKPAQDHHLLGCKQSLLDLFFFNIKLY